MSKCEICSAKGHSGCPYKDKVIPEEILENGCSGYIEMKPEEKARVKIDKQLEKAGWYVVARDEYAPQYTSAIKEARMRENGESDYLLFVDNKAIAVVEAKREENSLGDDVKEQVEDYARNPEDWVGLWFPDDVYKVPLVYLANGRKIFFKNMLHPESEYVELSEMHSPKKMLQLIGRSSDYGALPRLDKEGLRDCQYEAVIEFEKSLKDGKKKSLADLATGSGKTYLASLISYRLLNYTSAKRVLFLVDRNNLARQAESEFKRFDLTEERQELGSLYDIRRLRNDDDQKADIAISTIQKLYAVLTGNILTDDSEDAEDERNTAEEEREDQEVIQLGDDLRLPPDYFQLIIVDECHRSIYGRWRAVLDYFSGAHVLGLTATRTPVAFAFFDGNIIKRYTYEHSVVEGVNVPYRVYRISTRITEHGGTIEEGTEVKETTRRTGEEKVFTAPERIDYDPDTLDRSIVNPNQIRVVLEGYKQAIYTELYPERAKQWDSIPKTLIFAKSEDHATRIVEIVKEVFGQEFEGGVVPEHFVQKITYTAEDSNGLIRDFRTEKDFRIAVTVTLVATGTDVKPLEVVLFMKDVQSDVLYTQMKGRGCRVIADDRLREVTPNADTKQCFYIVDAIGVTEHEKSIPQPSNGTGANRRTLTLEQLLERMAHNELSDDNLWLLRDYCAAINRRYENNRLFGRHLTFFIETYGFAPRMIAENIQTATDNKLLDRYPYVDPSHNNPQRKELIDRLISNLDARKKLLEMRHGYTLKTEEDPDELISAGFSREDARSFIENFENYLSDNRDSIEALRIIYNSEKTVITHEMLADLKENLLSANPQYKAYQIWKNYKVLDETGSVDDLDLKANVDVLTNLIQIVRYAYGKSAKLTSLTKGWAQRFSLYCGQTQRDLTEDQKAIMRQIAEYVIVNGAIDVGELQLTDGDLWRKGVLSFTVPILADEMTAMSRILLSAI